jgi:hypothetical protein
VDPALRAVDLRADPRDEDEDQGNEADGVEPMGHAQPELVVDERDADIDPGPDEEPEELHHPSAALDRELGRVDERDPECPQPAMAIGVQRSQRSRVVVLKTLKLSTGRRRFT